MSTTPFLAHLDDDLTRLESVPVDADAPIPSCPGWSAATLVNHLGLVFLWNTASLAAAPDDDLPAFPEERAPSDPHEAHAWLVAAGRRFASFAGELDAADVRPSWAGPQPVSWFRRRVTLETAVHRWDLENGSAVAAGIPVDLAGEGIEEWLEFASARPDLALTGTVHLHGTDDAVAGEWLIEPGPPLAWTTTHGKGDVAVRGPLSDLYLALWGRIGTENLEIFGDPDVLSSLISPT